LRRGIGTRRGRRGRKSPRRRKLTPARGPPSRPATMGNRSMAMRATDTWETGSKTLKLTATRQVGFARHESLTGGLTEKSAATYYIDMNYIKLFGSGLTHSALWRHLGVEYRIRRFF